MRRRRKKRGRGRKRWEGGEDEGKGRKFKIFPSYETVCPVYSTTIW
jgi:hypothetical protein